ncbi:MAG: hypothetical protein ACJ74T_12380 [Pyrinomonadaceae bacterium]
MKKRKHESLKLKRDHHWRARPGHRIFVADRGAVRFDFPQAWVLKMNERSVCLYDREPPEDDCRLEVSFMRLPPIDWSGMPVEQLLDTAVGSDTREVEGRGQTYSVRRHGLRLAWAELTFKDPFEQRPARSRILVGIGNNIQCLITFDFWEDDAARLAPAWDEVVRTLELGIHIQDPTTGLRRDPSLN